METESIVFDTDSYKTSHFLQYPPGTSHVFSYIESRGGRFDETVMFGLQYYLKKYMTKQVTQHDVDRAAKFYAAHGVPFNKDGWDHVVNDHGGKLPLRIRAVAEGAVVRTYNALVTVENTCPQCFWLTSWVETMLLRVWYPITVATESRACKKIIKSFLNQTADDPNAELPFKLHDFGARGVSSQESAAIGGAAHLVNFMGSDTVVGVLMANEFYDCEMAAFSIPAAEHSTITSWGRDGELHAYSNMLKQFAKPGSLVAVVSDSYNIYDACEKIWGDALREDVVNSGATVIIRPDSGDPTSTVLKCLKILDAKFGSTVNSKGYKVLNNVRIIQGDGIDRDTITNILSVAAAHSFSASNIAFGMGGALLQHHNRDTQKFAMKCSSVVVDGKSVDVFKDPVTDPGKKSKSGRLDLVRDKNGAYTTIKLYTGPDTWHPDSVMETVFLNGHLTKTYTFAEVRKNASL